MNFTHTTFLRSSVLLICGFGAILGALAGPPGPGIKPPPVSAFGADLLKKSSGSSTADLDAVQRSLTRREDLLKLNTAKEYAELSPRNLAVSPILLRLAKNRTARAGEILAKLSTDKVFLAEESRAEALLLTLPERPGATPEALALLGKSLAPGNGRNEIAVRILFEMKDPAALDLFAKQVLDARHEAETLTGWMRDPLLQNRRDPAVLQMCLDLLTNPKLDAGLKNTLVNALFDYHPAEWYAGDGQAPKPQRGIPGKATGDLFRQLKAAVAADDEISAANKKLAAGSTR